MVVVGHLLHIAGQLFSVNGPKVPPEPQLDGRKICPHAASSLSPFAHSDATVVVAPGAVVVGAGVVVVCMAVVVVTAAAVVVAASAVVVLAVVARASHSGRCPQRVHDRAQNC